jgi:probable HAF family extracellular repeat protein
VDYPALENGYTLTGTITTDGATGVLSGSDVVNWNVNISQGNTLLTHADPSTGFIQSCNNLHADATGLWLPEGAPGTKIFNVVDGNLQSDTVVIQYNFGTISDFYTGQWPGNGVLWNYNLGNPNQITGNFIVATPEAVPEPASIALLLAGGMILLVIVSRRHRLGLAAVVAATAPLSAGLAQASTPAYSLVDLGALTGGTSTWATGINSAGQVVGWATNSSGNTFAFLYSGGSIQNLGTLGGLNSEARDINDAGQVAGDANDSSGNTFAFLYSAGSMQSLGAVGGHESFSYSINNAGQIVGWATNSGGVGQAFRWSGGSMQNLGALPGYDYGGQAFGINDNGVVSGYSEKSSGGEMAFVWSGSLHSLGTFPGGTWSEAQGINNEGQVVGWTGYNSNGVGSAFLWSGGSMQSLGTMPGYTHGSGAYNINDQGSIVGSANNNSFADHAFLYTGGSMQDLNSLIADSSGWDLEDAFDINNSGQICGIGINPSGQTDAFLLTPVPEPSTFALLGATFILFAFAWHRDHLRRAAIVATIALLPLSTAKADVFNMPAGQTSLQFVTVGDPGNVADTAVMGDGTTGYGSVSNVYRMGKYDVTLGQYVQFLNAVAKTDTYGCYNSLMAGFDGDYAFGIAQAGSAGSYSYSVTGSNPQAANMPLYSDSWLDAARFCNWLQNGQPTGSEGTATTEGGAYTLNGDTTSGLETRNAGARYFIPSENEWYKAAYYKSGGTNAGYWTYPTQSNTAPGNALTTSQSNEANYFNQISYTDPMYYLTPVGAFSGSPGPYGTYDMGGDLNQWDEAIVGAGRVARGGNWNASIFLLAANWRGQGLPTGASGAIGFRVASSVPVPEPASVALLVAGGVYLPGYRWRKRPA